MRSSIEKLEKRDVLPFTNEFKSKSMHASILFFETGNTGDFSSHKDITDTVRIFNEKKYSIIAGPYVLIEEYSEVFHATSFAYSSGTTEWTEIEVEYSSQQIVTAIPLWLS